MSIPKLASHHKLAIVDGFHVTTSRYNVPYMMLQPEVFKIMWHC